MTDLWAETRERGRGRGKGIKNTTMNHSFVKTVIFHSAQLIMNQVSVLYFDFVASVSAKMTYCRSALKPTFSPTQTPKPCFWKTNSSSSARLRPPTPDPTPGLPSEVAKVSGRYVCLFPLQWRVNSAPCNKKWITPFIKGGCVTPHWVGQITN